MNDFFSDNNGNEKDYDLDYFAKREDKSESAPEDDDGDNFILNTFSTDDNFIIEPEEDEGDVSFGSFGKKRKDVKKDSKEEKKRKTKKILKLAGKIALSVFLICIITGILAIGAFAIYVFNFVDDTVYEDLDQLSLDFTSTIYALDSETGEYVEYERLQSAENRIWVDFDDMPDTLLNAYVATEDKRFRQHEGVDFKRTISAFANMFLHFYSSNQGGSTITQQLVKNLTGDEEDTPMRKIREIMRARYLESRYEKDTILECYLNKICLGGGIYGVEVASNYYFGKSTSELTLSECAALASIPKNPEKYRPDKNPMNNADRRKTVLKLMYDQGYISEAEYLAAKDEEITVVADETAKSSGQVNDWFVDTVIEEMIDRLISEYKMDEAYAAKRVYNGGYKIYSTVNPKIQKILETEYSKTDKYFTATSKKNDGKTVQSAFTIMDYEGHVVGIIGGAGEKTGQREYNRATMSFRQPGSTMKPLAAYSQAIQKNLIYYSKILNDSPLPNYFGAGKPGPRNSTGSYSGSVTAAKALERSINTIPCKLVSELGLETTYYWLNSNLGLSQLDGRDDLNLSALGLGGTTTGISTMQSAAAYAMFGNLGRYYAPTTFSLVTDQHDNVIFKQSSGEIAIEESTACILNHMLQNVVYGDSGTGRIAAGFSDKMKCYAKTGTSSETIDCWLAGGTPYYVGSCWFGFDISDDVKPATLAKTMWCNVMKEIHKDLEVKEFEESEFVTKRYFCTETGLLATDACEHVSVGYYKTTVSLPAACTHHEGTLLPEIVEKKSGEDDTSSSSSSSKTTSSKTTSSKETSSESKTSSSEKSSSAESAASSTSNEQTSKTESTESKETTASSEQTSE